jgi:tetratricopeptide (TPR) repeat protein
MLYHHAMYKEDRRMDGGIYIQKAYESILNGDFEQAIDWFDRAIEAEPANADYHYKCSISCSRSGKWAKALIHAEKAAELEPDREEYRFHKRTIDARLLLHEAEKLLAAQPPQTEDAMPLLRKATELDPLSFEAFYLLGLACAGMNRPEEGAAYAREALRLDPGHSAARTLYADLRRKLRYSQRRAGRHKRRKHR